MNFNSLDFQSIWEDTMGWNTYLPDSRKFNDKIESDFWIRLAPLYTEKYNLNADTDKIAAKLHELLGDNHSIRLRQRQLYHAYGRVQPKGAWRGFFAGNAGRTA